MKSQHRIPWILPVFFFAFCFPLTVEADAPPISARQSELMQEEYHMVRQMRHRLRALLERQQMENTMQESSDVFQDLQRLEQWLQNLKQQPGAENTDELLRMLDRFEERLKRSLEEQEHAGEWLRNMASPPKTVEIPLNVLMRGLRKLIRDGRIGEAQQLLDQLLSLLNRQQQSLETAISDYYNQQFSDIERQLGHIMNNAKRSLFLEKQVQKQIQPHSGRHRIPADSGRETYLIQKRISELIRYMQNNLKAMPESPMLNTRQTFDELLESEKHSRNTEKHLGRLLPQPALNAAQESRNSLQRLLQNLQNLRQQTRRMSRGRMPTQSREPKRRYWSEKGVRPLRLEYEFQANPMFRDAIQQKNLKESASRTERQQQYLKEVTR